MILAIVLVLLMLFCAVAEFCRIWIIAQGVKEAAQQAVISTVNDNYDDVYHAVREGYAAGWYPDGTGRWDESIDTGDVSFPKPWVWKMQHRVTRSFQVERWSTRSPVCLWNWRTTALALVRARVTPLWWRFTWRFRYAFSETFCPLPT